MANDDQQLTNAVPEADPSIPVADLDSRAADAKAADHVRGGAGSAGKVHTSDIQVVKHTDSSTPS